MPPPLPPPSDDDGSADRLGDDKLEIELRSPGDVAERCIVLATVCRRAFLEARSADVVDVDDERFDLAAWLRDEGLDPAVSRHERALVDTDIGRLDPDAAIAALWQGEALAALGWALGLLDVAPGYDGPASLDLAPLLSRLPAPWDRTASFRRSATLREEGAVAHERERAELWSWRVGAAEAMATARGDTRAEIAAAIAEVSQAARTAGFVTALVEGDFSVGGRPVRALDPDALADIGQIADQRLRALNWLCGFGADWDDVPLDV